MKKFINYILSLFILVVLLNFFFSFLLDAVISKSNFRWINLFNESPSAYVIGNSRGVNSVTESEFNGTCNIDILNLSYNGLKPSEIYYLSTFIDSEKPLIIEVTAFLHNTNSNVDKFRFSSIKNLRNYSDWSTKIFPLFNYNNDLTLRLLYYSFSDDKSWVNNGVLSDKEIEIATSKLEETTYNTNELYDFIDYLNNRNQKYILYHAPIHLSYRKTITNIDKTLFEIKTTYPSFLDLSDILNENKYFADLGHSNHLGSNYIKKYICDHLNLNISDN